MEYRKLISFGNSSFVISLPKPWLNSNGLKKGDTLYLDVNDSEIIVSAQEQSEPKEKVKRVINVDNLGTEVIRRKINAAYINNADEIRFKGNSISKKTKEIKDMIQNLVAMEVVEQNTEKIVAKSFLNIDEVELDNILRKADHIVKSMLKDLIQVAKKPVLESVEISDNISQRDTDLNRMSFLIFRVLNHSIKNGRSTEKTSPNMALGLWGFNFFLEEIGDEVKRIARLLAQCDDKELLQEYAGIIEKAAENYKDIMKGFYKNDKELIYEVASGRNELIQECEDLLEDNLTPLMVGILDKTKDMIDKIHNLNRISTMSGILPVTQ